MSITLLALDLPRLEFLARDPSRLDGTSVAVGALPPPFILEGAVRALREGKPMRWFSPFAFIEDRLNRVVGTGGFKGAPVDGRVEIGYGVAEQFRGRGFATAAVRKLVRLALAAPGVVEVYAETAVGNASSRRVVEKAGFRHLGQSETKDDGIVDQWLSSRWQERSSS